jgi:thiol-disulfide isomerase/thioredoxin
MRIRPGKLAWCLLIALLAAQRVAFAEDLKPWRGGPTPALSLSDAEGKTVGLRDLRGKVVVINFWATWCEPCRDEMPSLARLQRQMAGKPVVVLAVNMGESESKVADFLGRFNIDLKVLFDRDMRAASRWKVRALPATFVVGPDGRIRYSLLGQAEWDSPPVVAAIRALLPPSARQDTAAR